MSHRVLVIGAQGTLGSFIARAFADAGWAVTRAGRRPETAPDFRLLNLSDPKAVSDTCRAADIVVNTAQHPDLAPERTTLRQGGTLINLTDLSPSDRAQLTPAASEALGLVVTDAGMAGVAYLAIAELLDEHPEADGVEYALMFANSMSMGRAGALFAHSLLTGCAHHPTARIPFPPPIGRRRCLKLTAKAADRLRPTVDGRKTRYYLLMQPPALQRLLLALNALRLVSLLPQAMLTAGTRKAPHEPSTERVCDWVAITHAGKRLATRTIEGNGYYRMTAAATLTFAEALTKPPTGAAPTGLRSVDELLTLVEIHAALRARGIAVQAATSTTPGPDAPAPDARLSLQT
ncbi:MAG: NAD-dependent epimerase/dehydratase family protein [Chloroflexota bacterium]|nr:NAD-dependent epimerase/dehydratase family protein [Chloroflexota bacterium]